MGSRFICLILVVILCSLKSGSSHPHGHARPHMGRTYIRPAPSHHNPGFRSGFHNQPHSHGNSYIRPAATGSSYNDNYRHGLFDKLSSWVSGRSESIPHRHTTHHHRYNPMKDKRVQAHLSVDLPPTQPYLSFWRLRHFLSLYPSYDSFRSGFTLTVDLFRNNLRFTNILVLLILNIVFIQFNDPQSQEDNFGNLLLYNLALLYLILLI